MKLGLATTLSVAGVLSAGAAALVVNTSVLNATSDVAVGLPATSNSDNAQPTNTTNTTPSALGNNNAGEAGIDVVGAKVVSSSAGLTTFAVGDAGTVVVDTTSGSIVIRDIVPSAGWESMQAIPGRNGSFKIHFTKGNTKKELRLSLVDGKIVAVVVDESGQSTAPSFNPNDSTAPVDTLPAFLGGDDDDDDDQFEDDDDHDDEDHEDYEDGEDHEEYEDDD